MAKHDGTLMMENAKIIFRNFAGREGLYNAEGDRNFCLLLDDETGRQLAEDGWSVKTLKARDEGDTPQMYIQVSVKYRGRSGNAVRPPSIVMITSKGRTNLAEDMVEVLDWVDISSVDLIIRPFEWAVNGKTGIKAYLKSMFVTMDEDELDQKYNTVPYADEDAAEHEDDQEMED